MFRLYCGFEAGGVWYNQAELKSKIDGGLLSMLDTEDRSSAKKMVLMVMGATDKFISSDGTKEISPSEHVVEHLKVIDTWKFGMELRKKITRSDFPSFSEYFYCPRCSKPQAEHYTEVEESWEQLIVDGFIDEHFLGSFAEAKWTTVLPVPVEMPESGRMAGVSFNTVERELLSLKQMKTIQNTPNLLSTEASYVYALWDSQITAIDGFSEKDINIHVKRDLKDSFARRHLSDAENQEAMMSTKPNAGLDASFRKVSCRYCGNEIGGYLDFTNFFDYLNQRKSTRQDRMAI